MLRFKTISNHIIISRNKRSKLNLGLYHVSVHQAEYQDIRRSFKSRIIMGDGQLYHDLKVYNEYIHSEF